MQWYIVASLLTVLTSSQESIYAFTNVTVALLALPYVLTLALSQSNGGYEYDFATVPFLAEVLKRMQGVVFSKDDNRMEKYSIMYLIHNTVQFATLTYVDTSTYQRMGNLKIVTTGILIRLFLRRKLSNLQWIAMVLLAVGTTTSQVKGCGEASCDSLFSSSLQGHMLGVLSACLSALAGVYTEFLMKKNNDSLYWQNFQLYTYIIYLFLGIVICIMSLHMYFSPPNILVDLPLPVKTPPESLINVSVDQRTDT